MLFYEVLYSLRAECGARPWSLTVWKLPISLRQCLIFAEQIVQSNSFSVFLKGYNKPGRTAVAKGSLDRMYELLDLLCWPEPFMDLLP